MLGVMSEIFSSAEASVSGDGCFLEVSKTMPLVAGREGGDRGQWPVGHGAVRKLDAPLTPSEVSPWLTAARACSIWTS